MKKRVWPLYGLIILLLAGVYNALLFLIKKEFTAAQWVCYGFTMFFFAMLFMDAFIPKEKFRKYPMFGVPIAQQTLFFFSAQLLFGGMLVMFYDGFPTLAAWIVEILAVGTYIGILLLFLLGKQIVERQDETASGKVFAIRALGIELDAIHGNMPAGEAKELLEKLIEEVRYSDPMSSDSLASIEERIRMKVSALRDALDEGRCVGTEEYSQMVQSIRSLVRERNQQCLLLKG